MIKIKLLSEKAIIPRRDSLQDIGLILHAAKSCMIKPRDKVVVPTDLQIELPTGCYGRITQRPGLSYNRSIAVGTTIIDSDYRENVSVVIFNFSNDYYRINHGSRIAQLICEQIIIPESVIQLR
ncbi:deoxyuridine 5'-triphosphate nucleotidohydrolase, mitochondrial-like [Panonychus citri]|uniref:deoxyuridine 5'-triphosphate nucleotidohydrolase, mitochondrial-like n=1 Tax=Panonychus citri TaxID=50023 RepID=UPI002307479F|nr:deoxyuridine 5'-triphosphate nucleotidohydrolase, mitochondrial-like [Panonychus citri]